MAQLENTPDNQANTNKHKNDSKIHITAFPLVLLVWLLLPVDVDKPTHNQTSRKF